MISMLCIRIVIPKVNGTVFSYKQSQGDGAANSNSLSMSSSTNLEMFQEPWDLIAMNICVIMCCSNILFM